jgi:DNA-binding transcriptional LysR family regulator
VPAVLREFRETMVDVDIILDEAGTGELVDSLLRERLDAVFVRSGDSELSGLLVDPVLVEPMLLAMPSGHPRATVDGAPVSLKSLANEAFVLYRRPSGPGLHDAIWAACAAVGFSPKVKQEAPRLPGTLSLVAAGLGVTIVPASMQRMNTEGVAYRALSDCLSLTAPLHLAMRRTIPSPVLARFRELVRKRAGELDTL